VDFDAQLVKPVCGVYFLGDRKHERSPTYFLKKNYEVFKDEIHIGKI
jgi:hypothetical protein